MGQPDKIIDITVAIDKLDKIGVQGVIDELSSRGLSEKAIDVIKPIINIKGDNSIIINSLKELLKSSEIGLSGVAELEYILNYYSSYPLLNVALQVDMTLARGLNYYTGAIFEVTVDGAAVGSVSGGGRYDNLTGSFGMKDVSGVGISFGADRIYDVMLDQSVFPDFKDVSTQLLIINSGEYINELVHLSNEFRDQGVVAEFYPDNAKLIMQLKYAYNIGISHVLFVTGDQAKLSLELKNMESGEQYPLDFNAIVEKLNN